MFRTNQPLIMATTQPRAVLATPHRPLISNQFPLMSQPSQIPYVVRDHRFAPIAPMVQYIVPVEKKKKPAPEPVVMKVVEKKEEPAHPKYYEPYYKYFDGVFFKLV